MGANNSREARAILEILGIKESPAALEFVSAWIEIIRGTLRRVGAL